MTEEPLRLGFHAPVTGAGPLPIDAFERTLENYWRWQTEVKQRRILGRSEVAPQLRDDKYNASTAAQVCRELSAEHFLVFGGGGADQIQACGRVLEAAQVPYIAAGVTELALEGMQWHFSAWMTYPRQVELLAQLITARFPGQKTAMIAMDTPSFDDAVVAFEAAVARLGIPYHGTLRHPKGGEGGWYGTYARDLASAGVEVVVPLTSADDYIRFAKIAYGHNYQPTYVGTGIGQGFDKIAAVTCPAGHGSLHLSPFPAMDRADEFDPEFREAMRHFGDERHTDDFAWVVWGASRLLHVMFDRYEAVHGTDLDQGRFRGLLEGTGEIDGGIYPPVRYGPDTHFGGSAMHLLRAECGPVSGRYVTDTTYASRF